MEESKDTPEGGQIAVFKCNKCNSNRPHKILDHYLYQDDPLWLVVCENCQDARIIYVKDQIDKEAGRIVRCKCGKYKLGNQQCEICKILDERG